MTFLKKGNGTREVAAEPGAMMKATGRIGVDMIPVMAVSLAVVIGDLIAIPFVDILKRTSDASHDSGHQSNIILLNASFPIPLFCC